MPNFYGLYFTRDGVVMRLPVNPETLPVSRENANSEYNVLGLGPVTIPRIPKAREVKISGYFPGLPQANVLSLLNFKTPAQYIEFFQSAMNDRAPILFTPARFYETGIPFAISDVGFYVLVTKFDTEERGGETGDFYFDLECVERRDPAPAKVQIAGTSGAASTASAAAAAASRARAAGVETTSAAAQTAAALTVSTEPVRSIPRGQIVVGSTATLNGGYYYSPELQQPYTPAAGLSVIVRRIEDGSLPAPVYVSDAASGEALGWVAKSMLSGVINK